jgi:uracil-DNA glycosylase
MDVKLEPSWKQALRAEFAQPYFDELANFVKSEYQNHIIYPPGSHIFKALELTPFDQIKVIILGQDPYHGPKQAQGLSFSVSRDVKVPPSLQNIYKELNSDLGLPIPNHGDLTSWAEQGVLLLNATLTVRAKSPGSHQGKGWELFTDAIIKTLNVEKSHLVFMLWGKYAQAKANLIDNNKHLVLTAAHPSPYSAHSGFFGCQHFSKCNEYLIQNGIPPINWEIS